jgi:hypothetical protein
MAVFLLKYDHFVVILCCKLIEVNNLFPAICLGSFCVFESNQDLLLLLLLYWFLQIQCHSPCRI